jgi:hypothetical protein
MSSVIPTAAGSIVSSKSSVAWPTYVGKGPVGAALFAAAPPHAGIDANDETKKTTASLERIGRFYPQAHPRTNGRAAGL